MEPIFIIGALFIGFCLGVLVERTQTDKHYNKTPKKTYKF